MNTKLTALKTLCNEIQNKIEMQQSIENLISDIDMDYVKEKEAETIKECCFLLAKFMQDNRMKIVEPAY